MQPSQPPLAPGLGPSAAGPQQPPTHPPSRQYGLAEELTQTGTLTQPPRAAPAAQLQLQGLPPMQRRPSGDGRHAGPAAAQPRPTVQPRAAPAFGLDPQAANATQPQRAGPFGVPRGAGTAAGSAPATAAPYGLVAELAGAGPVNPLATRPAAADSNLGPLAAAIRRQQVHARRGLTQQLDNAVGPQSRPQGPGMPQPDPSAVAAAIAAGAPEPDYGIVAELRGGGATNDPFLQRNDFGLAAEVARRRQRLDAGASAPMRGSLGGSLAAKPRRRLAATGPPADFGLAEQLAAMQAQAERDRADPFNTANRASNADPFVMAGDLIKFPMAPFVPGEPIDQEVVGGPVPLKVPPSGGSVTSAVSQDEGEYGLAEELGVDPEEARRRRRLALDAAAQLEASAMAGPLLGYDENGMPILTAMPPPDFFEPQAAYKYVYDEDTGMLLPPEGIEGEGGKATRQYIEDVATGNFYRLNNPGMFRRMMSRMRRRQPRDDGEPEEGEEGWDPDKGTFRGRLRTSLRVVSSVFSTLGLFVQGLAGGFAMLNLFMTYFLYSRNSMREWLKYYASLSLMNNRIYYSLITLSLIASSSRLGRDRLRGYAPVSMSLKVVDWCQLLAYTIAYIMCVLCTPLDDELKYESGRNSRFYELTFSSGFKSRLSTWHGLNTVRVICSGVGWLLCCYQTSPFVTEGVIAWEVKQRLARRKAQKVHMSPVMAMAPQRSTHSLPPSKPQLAFGGQGGNGGGGGGEGGFKIGRNGGRDMAAGGKDVAAAAGGGGGGWDVGIPGGKDGAAASAEGAAAVGGVRDVTGRDTDKDTGVRGPPPLTSTGGADVGPVTRAGRAGSAGGAAAASAANTVPAAQPHAASSATIAATVAAPTTAAAAAPVAAGPAAPAAASTAPATATGST